MRCPRCGFENQTGNKFCMGCGSPITPQPVHTGQDSNKTVLIIAIVAVVAIVAIIAVVLVLSNPQIGGSVSLGYTPFMVTSTPPPSTPSMPPSSGDSLSHPDLDIAIQNIHAEWFTSSGEIYSIEVAICNTGDTYVTPVYDFTIEYGIQLVCEGIDSAPTYTTMAPGDCRTDIIRLDLPVFDKGEYFIDMWAKDGYGGDPIARDYYYITF